MLQRDNLSSSSEGGGMHSFVEEELVHLDFEDGEEGADALPPPEVVPVLPCKARSRFNTLTWSRC